MALSSFRSPTIVTTNNNNQLETDRSFFNKKREDLFFFFFKKLQQRRIATGPFNFFSFTWKWERRGDYAAESEELAERKRRNFFPVFFVLIAPGEESKGTRGNEMA